MKTLRIKHIFVLFSVVVGFLAFNSLNVEAAESSYELTKGGKIWYSSSGYIIKHYFGSTPAYCMQWRLSTYNGSKYTQFTPSSMTERNAFIAGYAIRLVEEDYPDNEDMRHLYATEIVNCLFGLSGSVCYQKGKDYIAEATTYVDNEEKLCEGTNTSGCLNNESFKLGQSGSTLNQIGTSSNFISNKITLSGLLTTYGGAEFGVTYTVSAKSSAGNSVFICSNATGTSCSSSNAITLTDAQKENGSYSFYVKVNSAQAGSTVKITASASNKAVYPYGIAYRYTSSYQALMITEDKTVTRNLSRVATLNVPDKTKYTISARKVDENGEDLTGASFEIYRADLETGEEIKILKKNSDGAATLAYVEEEYTTSSDWFKYKYCLRETSAPSGYVYNKENELKNPLCLPVGNAWENGSVCYNSENEEVNDTEKCNAHTKKCLEGEFDGNSESCILTETATFSDSEATASCPDGYEFNDDKTKCLKKESGDTSLTITSETSTSTVSSDTLQMDGDFSASGTNTEKTEVDVSYVCPKSDNVERFTTEEEKVMCRTYTCETEGYNYDSTMKTCVKNTGKRICVSDQSAYKDSNYDENIGVDMSYCDDTSSYTFVTISGGNIDFVKTNNRNAVTISKVDITGEKELSGAKMKICTTKPNASLECEIAYVTRSGQCNETAVAAGICTNVSNDTMKVQMQWTSDIASRTIRGLATGQTYYLVETVAPLGYEISQFTKFSISDDGTVTSEETVVADGKILVKNDVSMFTVSKQDAATSKELPGAEITICYAGMNEDGEYQMGVDEEGKCTVPTLLNGDDAKWVSTNEPHIVEGLSAGAYYLVETITPNGYDTAEKIFFILNQDGTLTDKDGNSLKDNKLIMKDVPIKQVPTGDVMIVLIIVLGVVGLGIGVYYYFRYYKKSNKL